jgi:phosphatidylglycerol:prolipoprotein diacylglycerol transferase
MPLSLITYPAIGPEAFHIGSFAIDWYALAYSGGLICMWLIALALVKHKTYWDGADRPKPAMVDYLILYIFFGTAIGGRLGEVAIRPGFFWSHPAEIPAVWHGGGLAFGAMIGGGIAVWIFARRNKCSFWTALDICSPGGAIGLGLGRIASFLRPELWGRRTSVPWAMIFPDPRAGSFPRHPSQIYEATLEGLLVFAVLMIVIRSGALKRPGFVAGLFVLGYGLARFFCEFFKEPDPEIFNISPYFTAGMMLCIPTIVAGAWVMSRAAREGQ